MNNTVIRQPPRSGKSELARQELIKARKAHAPKDVWYLSYSLPRAQRNLDKWLLAGSPAVGPGVALCGRGWQHLVIDSLIENSEDKNAVLSWLQEAVLHRAYPDATVFSISSSELQARMVLSVFASLGPFSVNYKTMYDLPGYAKDHTLPRVKKTTDGRYSELYLAGIEL